jgi:hypothetical protein
MSFKRRTVFRKVGVCEHTLDALPQWRGAFCSGWHDDGETCLCRVRPAHMPLERIASLEKRVNGLEDWRAKVWIYEVES